MKQVIALARKELDSYFSSPMALIFVGVFLVTTLFTFFWVDGFFGRGVADVRSLFRWLPILMIFLVAALTMRQWSEEQQTGTLEILLTMPVRLAQLVLGKFLAVLALVAVALALTLFLPITVGLIGNLDAGPVIGGYLAALLMAAAYIAIGLFVSSRTDNQLVALILTVIVCGLFHLVGSSTIVDLVPAFLADLLRAIGTGSRFESIERGVIDLRDLLYYVSLTVIFLGLNVLSLDSKRWSIGANTESYRRNATLTIGLIAVNLVLFNALLFPVNTVRADLTQDGEYSLSQATRDILQNLQEPLLIRGYFSKENHPYLAPLIPRIEDLLEEYKVAAGDNLQLEFLDPIDDPQLEAEANQIYGIEPSPLQVSDRSEVSVRNVYFDILIRYGDQNVVLNYSDLIEVKSYGTDVEVSLRNLEYDLTSAIQRVVFGFQSVDAVLASLDEPAHLTLYYTPSTLPNSLAEVPTTIQTVADDIASGSNGRFVFQSVDVDDPNDDVTPESLYNRYQLQPIAASFFSTDTYYLHMILEAGGKVQAIYPSGALSEADIRDAIESGLKRASSGFLTVVGLWTPPSTAQTDMFGQQIPNLAQYTRVSELLGENYEVRTVDLSSGQVDADIDVLMVIAPQNLTDGELYAIDQYLMRGGRVFVAAGNYQLAYDSMNGNLGLQATQGNLKEMLASYGITVGDSLVMDTQNEPFPATVQRNVGGAVVNEIQALDYPFFVDVRADGMDSENPVTNSLQAITLNWASPLTVDETLNADRTVTPLLSSTGQSWLTTDTNIQPNTKLYPEWGFPVGSEHASHLLAVAVQGSFESFFKGRQSPFETEPAAADASADAAAAATPSAATTGTLEASPASAQLIVVGSNEFLNDIVFSLSNSLSGERYLNSIQFVQNAVDWFTQDSALAEIRTRGTTARLLKPLSDQEQSFWEALNYVLALLALGALYLIWRMRKRSEQPMPLVLPAGASGPARPDSLPEQPVKS